ncbi:MULTISPECIES: dimethyl sulfoxide reductase anchor subunit family protein [Salipiger]|uniref:dimethyl sulfoxide reductase anchor subunit family protein n=1 Tax=Salipiger TaxID=263377 RepID=UPI003511FCD5
MHPAPSIILFTTLSGLGFGLLIWLGVDPTPPTAWVAFAFYAIAYALALSGLAASSFHLGRRDRALKAFRQWRTSWLSREAWLAALALGVSGLHALGLLFGIALLPLGWLGAALSLATVAATAMIYAQLRTVPRWYHWSTPILFIALSLSGGALLSGRVEIASGLLLLTGALQFWAWYDGDRRFTRSGTTLASATGLGEQGVPRALFPPHTGSNYLLDEMVYVVARRHALKLRSIALVLMVLLPVLLLQLPMPHLFGLLALACHLAGALTARWLFFAEAEHVVGLYYGER